MSLASCCCGNDPDEACGHPPKTIRATISVTVCIISFILFAFLVVYFCLNEQYTNAMGIAGMISTELGTVIGYYFGHRSSQEVKEQVKHEVKRRLLMDDEA